MNGINLTSSIISTKTSNGFLTPKKAILNALISSDIKQLIKSPKYNQNSSVQEINLDIITEPLHLLKDRYLLTNSTLNTNSQQLTCTDIYTEEIYQCKPINDSLNKIQLAYFNLKYNNLNSEYDLINPFVDAIQITKKCTYLLLSSKNNYGDLHSYVKSKRRINEQEAIRLFKQICDIVGLCHRNGIVLRDLKLKKFHFIDSERTTLQYESLEGAFILDDPDMDVLSEKIGCPLYVAPELITSNLTYCGYAADMWSLGIILYTLLVGRYPFSDSNGQNLFNKILFGDLMIPHFLSPKAKCLLRSLLRRNPDERPTTDDIVHHPWFNSKESHTKYNDCGLIDDQIVPDLSFEENTDICDSG